jgi:hypothetical protein
MKQIAILAALFSMVIFTSCRKHTLVGEGAIIDETRELPAFESVQADGSLDVVVYPSTSNKVVVSGYSNLVPVFETEVINGKLRLRYPDKYINVRHDNIHVTVYTTAMSSYAINGSGKTVIKADQNSPDLALEINGSGDIDIEQNQFVNVNCKINGSGNINGRQCAADHATMRISGSGNIEMTVNKTMDVDISGSGDVNYWGSASVTNADISGSGKIKKRS